MRSSTALVSFFFGGAFFTTFAACHTPSLVPLKSITFGFLFSMVCLTVAFTGFTFSFCSVFFAATFGDFFA